MPDEIIPQGCAREGSTHSCLTLLMMEARGLHLLCHKIALRCVATGDPEDRIKAITSARADLAISLNTLRNSESTFLRSYAPSLAVMMGNAFTEDVDATFDAFDKRIMALSADHRPRSSALQGLLQFLSTDMTARIDEICAVAQRITRIGGQDAEKRALTDDLTGLPNRRALNELLQRSGSTEWPHEKVAVIQMDLDKLKQINDTLGHAAGDAALVHTAQAMWANAQDGDFLARMSGDEFIFICFGNLTERDIKTRAERLVDHISLPFIFRGKTCNVSCSVGIAHGSRDNDISLERYVTQADLALYDAKNSGRNRVRLFTPQLRTRFEEMEKLQSEIRDGLEAGEFVSYFQPQVEGRSGKLVGIEALARWNHPTRGLLEPVHFLKAVADSGFRDRLDRLLTQQALHEMRRWLDLGARVPQISINLTATRLIEVDLVDNLLLATDRAGLPSHMVGLEILENVMIDSNSIQMIDNIHGLSDAGFKVELDDFGTGHASISNLRNFKVDRIKIDRSFVKDVHLYSELAKILSAMIGLAHSLRLDALAEGVESPEERLVLNALGVDHIQGFGVARPMLASDVPEWVHKTQQALRLPARRSSRAILQDRSRA